MNEHNIERITDVLKLTDDEFKRFLPDLCVWFKFAKLADEVAPGCNTGFIWVDDSRPGVITEARAIDPATGEQYTVDLGG